MHQEPYPDAVTADDIADAAVAIGKRLKRSGNSAQARADLGDLAVAAARVGLPVAAAQLRAAARIWASGSKMRKAIGATVKAIRAAA